MDRAERDRRSGRRCESGSARTMSRARGRRATYPEVLDCQLMWLRSADGEVTVHSVMRAATFFNLHPMVRLHLGFFSSQKNVASVALIKPEVEVTLTPNTGLRLGGCYGSLLSGHGIFSYKLTPTTTLSAKSQLTLYEFETRKLAHSVTLE